MQSKRFGIGWLVHQSVPTLLMPKKSKKQFDKENATAFACLLANVLPCKYCRRSYKLYMKQDHVYQVLQYNVHLTRSNHVIYWFNVHNRVNKKLDKPIIPKSDLQKVYKQNIVKTTTKFIEKLAEWLCFISMNFDVQVTVNESQEMELVKRLKQLCKLTKCTKSKSTNVIKHNVDLMDAFTGIFRKTKPSFLIFEKWEKVASFYLYIAYAGRILKNSNSPTGILCANRLNENVFNNPKAFCNRENIFESIFTAFKGTIPNCPRKKNVRERLESYRAGKCAAGTCK